MRLAAQTLSTAKLFGFDKDDCEEQKEVDADLLLRANEFIQMTFKTCRITIEDQAVKFFVEKNIPNHIISYSPTAGYKALKQPNQLKIDDYMYSC